MDIWLVLILSGCTLLVVLGYAIGSTLDTPSRRRAWGRVAVERRFTREQRMEMVAQD